jgi:VIT1/CCC1 family predicted Fe2+/Mn2+ transporter
MKEDIEHLKRMHSREAIRKRIQEGAKHSYLKDFVYGAMDGIVTTFAIVAGVAGAGLAGGVALILGFANIVADGFSMAVGNYLGTKSEMEQRRDARNMELRHIELVPDGEREEIRQIFLNKGIQGEELEKMVSTITSNKDLWVDTMLQEEFGLAPNDPSPLSSAFTTFISFAVFGLIPLVPYILLWLGIVENLNPVVWSAGAAGFAFFMVGGVKSRFVNKPWFFSGLETFLIGCVAAGLAYFVGSFFRA